MERSTNASGLFCGRRTRPSAVSVVFVHGAMDRGAAFLRCTRSLPDLSWLVYDRRGYGRSEASEPPNFDTHVADLVAILEEERAQSRSPIVVVGHSVGGTIALAAAASRPDLVDGLVIYECPLPWLPWWPNRSGPKRGPDDHTGPPGPIDPAVAAERFMRSVIGNDAWEALPAETRSKRLSEGPVLQAELSSSSDLPLVELSAVECPVVVARGSHAPDYRVETTAYLADHLAHAEAVCVAGASHGAHTGNPSEFAGLVRRACDLAIGHRADVARPAGI